MKSESKNEDNQSINYWPWVSLLLAVSPAIGYFAAYLYELEYFRYFGIPSEFIVLDWTNLLAGVLTFVTFSYFLLLVFILPDLLQTSGVQITGIIRRRLIWISSVFLFVTLLVLQYSVSMPYIWVFYLIPLCFTVQIFVIPFISQRKMHGYRAKLIEHAKKIAKRADETPKWLKKYEKLIVFSSIAAIILILTAFLEGERVAVTKYEFLILRDYPRMVVLKAYKDYLICAPINADNRTFSRSFTIFPVINESGITLRPEKIGPLKPE